MTEFVIDASAAMSWVLSSQTTATSANFIARRRQEDRFVAPYIFSWEINNGLLVLLRRRGLSPASYSEAASRIVDLEIDILAPPSSADFIQILEVAKQVNLSLFDTAYLLTALNHDYPLISRDAALLEVTSKLGASCVDLR